MYMIGFGWRDNIPNIINGIRKAYEQKNHTNIEEIESLNNIIEGKNRKLRNIKTAIMTGFMEDDFKDEITKLKEDIEQQTIPANCS